MVLPYDQSFYFGNGNLLPVKKERFLKMNEKFNP